MRWLRILLFCCLATMIGVNMVRADVMRILIVDGFSNHDWQRTTECLKALLKTKNGYVVDVATIPAGKDEVALREAWCPDFSQYDVIIQNSNEGIGGTLSWGHKAQRALEAYVAGGGGMMAFHSANNAFASWPEYNKMLGLAWRPASYGTALMVNDDESISRIPPGEGKGTSHGARVDAVIHQWGNHPIYKGLPRVWQATNIEVYSYTRGPAENVTVLSYARDPVSGFQFPTEWVVAYGKGRVYTSTYGHVWPHEAPVGMQCRGFQTLFFRALSWLAKRPIDESCPKDFPGKVGQ